jgi:hypothetical protein
MPTADILIRVQPRSSRDEVVGWREEVLQVRLRAVPIEGKANEALRRFLARLLDLSPSQIEIISGASARHKRVRVSGIDLEIVRSRLTPGR